MRTNRCSRDDFLADYLPELRRRALFLFGDEAAADDELTRILPRLLGRRVDPTRTLDRATKSLVKAAERSSYRFVAPPDEPGPREAILSTLGDLDVTDRALLAGIDPAQLGTAPDARDAARGRLVAALIAAGHTVDGEDAVAAGPGAQPDEPVVLRVRTTDHSLFRRPEAQP